MIIIATTCLNMTERQFWKTTPRKFFALYHEYKIFNGLEKEKEVLYANEIF
jgi:hypothetical protein